MGMYTEVFVSTRIKPDEQVVETLKYMLGDIKDRPRNLPDHALFKEDNRWNIMLKCSSYYFVPRNIHLFEFDQIGKYWVLIVRSDFKNYQDEVNLFFDWLRTITAKEYGVMLGYSRYGEDTKPTIYYANDESNPNKS